MRKQIVFGKMYNVPRWVSRVDAERQQRHGWQVRWKIDDTMHNKFFKDKVYGSVEQSFAAAVEYARLQNQGIKNNMSFYCGVCLKLIGNHLYAEATHPMHGLKRYYAGVDGVVLYSKIEKVLAKAEAQRKIWYAEHQQWLDAKVKSEFEFA